MKIDKSKWHYRVWARSWSERERPDNTNLCRYFWRTTLFATYAGAWIAALLWGAIAAVYWGFYKTPFGWVVVGVIVLVVALRYASIAVREWVASKRYAPAPPREPGLLRAYLRAKKQRICPLIEFTEHGRGER